MIGISLPDKSSSQKEKVNSTFKKKRKYRELKIIINLENLGLQLKRLAPLHFLSPEDLHSQMEILLICRENCMEILRMGRQKRMILQTKIESKSGKQLSQSLETIECMSQSCLPQEIHQLRRTTLRKQKFISINMQKRHTSHQDLTTNLKRK